MPLKESTELLTIPVKVVNSFYQSLEDGSFDLSQDWGNFLDDIIALQPGLSGFKLIGGEAGTQTPDDRANMRKSLIAQMPNVPGLEAELWGDTVMGLHAVYSLIFARGFEAGQQHILQGNAHIQLLNG